MASKFYCLTHQEVPLRRDILGLPKRKGRHPVLDEAQDVALWERWKAGVTERHIALTDDMAMLALTMDLAAAMPLPMSVIWSAIRNWTDHEHGTASCRDNACQPVYLSPAPPSSTQKHPPP